jgi:hypothetical protein
VWGRVPLVGRGPKQRRRRGAPGTRCGVPRGDSGVAEPPLGETPVRGKHAGWGRAPWRGGKPNSDGETFVGAVLNGWDGAEVT